MKSDMEVKLKLQSLTPYITCPMCGGYLIDATTVTECLHTFCKSCLIKHLDQNSNHCPKCNVLIHRSHPLQHIKADRTLQDVIYKLVPNLHQSELQREKSFYLNLGMPYPKEPPKSPEPEIVFDPVQCREKLEKDEKLCIQLETKDHSFTQLPLKFIICSSNTTVQHLKKLIAKKVLCDLNKYCAIDILCNEEILGQDHTLKFIYVSRWRFEQPPLKLFYMAKSEKG